MDFRDFAAQLLIFQRELEAVREGIAQIEGKRSLLVEKIDRCISSLEGAIDCFHRESKKEKVLNALQTVKAILEVISSLLIIFSR